MTDFNFISIHEGVKASFYQLPRVFFESEKYINMSNDSKIAYAMLLGCCEYSIKNKWVDKSGNLYFIFTEEQLMDILHVEKNKVFAIKKELTSFRLLISKRITYGTKLQDSKKNIVTRIYLGQLEVDDADDFKYGKIAEHSKHFTSTQVIQKLKSFKQKETNKGTAEATELESYLHQNDVLLENFVSYMCNRQYPTFVPKRVLTLIQTFSEDFEEAEETVHTIQKAKRKVEELTGKRIIFEELIGTDGISAEQKLYTALMHAYRKKKSVKIANMQNVIFVFIKNLFQDELIHANKMDSLGGEFK